MIRFRNMDAATDHMVHTHHTTDSIDAMYNPGLGDVEDYHDVLHKSGDERMDKHEHKIDTCPPEHSKYGEIKQCPWCDVWRCPINMPDHIRVHHWDKKPVTLYGESLTK